MALQPGPAEFFDLAAAIPPIEPPLDPSLFTLNVPGLVDLDATASAKLTTLSEATDDLSGQTFGLYVDLETAGNELGGTGGIPPEPLPADLAAGIAETDGAMADAEAKVPDIVPEPPPGGSLPIPDPPNPVPGPIPRLE